MTNACMNFVPNVFDKNKCQNCFKSRDNHLGQGGDNSKFQTSKKVVGCGYLFISPQGLDFRNISDRSKRWQRRFFTLYDDGELVFSIDENEGKRRRSSSSQNSDKSPKQRQPPDSSDAIPQGKIHLASCRSVHGGESITGHANSIALHLDSGESYFLRAASRDEMQHWEKLLVAFSARLSAKSRLFPRSVSGPLPGQPQPPPRQQPPRRDTSPNTPMLRRSSKRGEYFETDLDYDMSRQSSSSKSSLSSRTRRRPMSVGDQLKTMIRSGERSPDDGKELTYLKKGWLFTRSPSDTKLQKRWCVLSDGVLSLYRDTLGEEEGRAELSLSLSPSLRVAETCDEMSYGFSLETSSGRFHFTAMTAGIRSNWVAALQTCLRTRRRHTTTVSTASEALSGDLCDAEVSQILRRESPADVLSEMYSLRARLEAAERSNADLEAECQRLSTQCQRLELDVVERDKLVSLPTDDELKLQRQLEAHDEALRASQERCLRAERCVSSINDRLAESLSAADEELSAAVRAREEAEQAQKEAEADRDAAQRRLSSERSHWEAALRGNEAENARLAREASAVRHELSRAAPMLLQTPATHEETLASLAALRRCWEEPGPGQDLLVLLRGLTANSRDPALRCRQGLLLSHLAARLGGAGDIRALRDLLSLPDTAPAAPHAALLDAVAADDAAKTRNWRRMRGAARGLVSHLRNHDALRQQDAKELAVLVLSCAAERLLGRSDELRTAVRGLAARLVDGDEEEVAEEDSWQDCLLLMALTAAGSIRPAETATSISPLSDVDWEAVIAESRQRQEEMHRSSERATVLEKEVERLQRLVERVRKESDAKDEHMAAMFEARQKAEEEARRLKQQQIQGSNSTDREEEDTLDFWKAELKQILEDELRMIPPVGDSDGLQADLSALQEQLEEEREAHAKEIVSLRKQFEAALEEETKATKIAIEAIERNYREKLENERNTLSRRHGDKAVLTTASRLTNSHATEERLTLLARRIASLHGRADSDC